MKAVLIEDKEGGWFAFIKELPAAYASGDDLGKTTLKQIEEELKTAVKEVIDYEGLEFDSYTNQDIKP